MKPHQLYAGMTKSARPGSAPHAAARPQMGPPVRPQMGPPQRPPAGPPMGAHAPTQARPMGGGHQMVPRPQPAPPPTVHQAAPPRFARGEMFAVPRGEMGGFGGAAAVHGGMSRQLIGSQIKGPAAPAPRPSQMPIGPQAPRALGFNRNMGSMAYGGIPRGEMGSFQMPTSPMPRGFQRAPQLGPPNRQPIRAATPHRFGINPRAQGMADPSMPRGEMGSIAAPTRMAPTGVAGFKPRPPAPTGPMWPKAWGQGPERMLGGRGVLSSGYGPRSSPGGFGSTWHRALDIAGPAGTQIRAPRAGRVAYSGWGGGYGNMVSIDHGGGLTSEYHHLNRDPRYRKGMQIKEMQPFAQVGSTGNSTGPHLDWQTKFKGQPFDPREFDNYYKRYSAPRLPRPRA